MRRLALRGSLRQWVARLHRWIGLVVLFPLFIASITGVWLVFRQELDRALNARLRVVRPAAARLSEDDIVTLTEHRFPDAAVSLVQFPQQPDDAVSISLVPRDNGSRERFDRVYVNQYTGEMLGQRRSRQDRISLASLDSLIVGVHFTLLAGEWGRWLMGIAAVAWLVTALIGLALSWPAIWLRLKSWLPILFPQPSGRAYKANYEVHRASGVWLLPVLIPLAFTSVALNLTEYVRPMVGVLSHLTPLPPGGHPVALDDAAVTFDQAAAAVLRMFPDARTTNVYRDLAHGRHSVYFHRPGDVNPQGDNFAFVDLRTARITALRLPSNSTAGDRFMAWLFPLHTGAAFGWPGRLAVALGGIATVVMSATGLYVWWVKWRMRRRFAMRSEHRIARSDEQNVRAGDRRTRTDQ
jgi:uncharacterized iron-regulated membrane protein